MLQLFSRSVLSQVSSVFFLKPIIFQLALHILCTGGMGMQELQQSTKDSHSCSHCCCCCFPPVFLLFSFSLFPLPYVIFALEEKFSDILVHCLMLPLNWNNGGEGFPDYSNPRRSCLTPEETAKERGTGHCNSIPQPYHHCRDPMWGYFVFPYNPLSYCNPTWKSKCPKAVCSAMAALQVPTPLRWRDSFLCDIQGSACATGSLSAAGTLACEEWGALQCLPGKDT